jgi:hypothetical protein
MAAVKKERGFELEFFSEPTGQAYAAFPDFKYLVCLPYARAS